MQQHNKENILARYEKQEMIWIIFAKKIHFFFRKNKDYCLLTIITSNSQLIKVTSRKNELATAETAHSLHINLSFSVS